MLKLIIAKLLQWEWYLAVFVCLVIITNKHPGKINHFTQIYKGMIGMHSLSSLLPLDVCQHRYLQISFLKKMKISAQKYLQFFSLIKDSSNLKIRKKNAKCESENCSTLTFGPLNRMVFFSFILPQQWKLHWDIWKCNAKILTRSNKQKKWYSNFGHCISILFARPIFEYDNDTQWYNQKTTNEPN